MELSSDKNQGLNKTIALVGPPNSGKTTLFNWLTGFKQKVVNYPGSTVDITIGKGLANLSQTSSGEQVTINFIDTPGTYSLFPRSPDEEVTVKTLFDPVYKISQVILVLDSTQIDRQWHLVRQLHEVKLPMIIAVTMHDLHVNEKSDLDLNELSKLSGVSVIPVDGTTGWGSRQLVQASLVLSAEGSTPVELKPWDYKKSQVVFAEGESVAKKVAKKKLNVFAKTEARDRVLLHPFWGLVIFLSIMTALFSSIYWLAQPLMDHVEGLFVFLTDQSKLLLGEGLLGQFVSDGLFAGMGSVMVFVPQIFILFLGISLLEDSGYLARAATLIDKPLSKLGLNGKAFVPLLSGFACAVPAMMAARSINSKKEKWIVMFILPFMTCSARLPVYALLISFLYYDSPLKAGILLAVMYFGAVLVGAVASVILNKFVKIPDHGFYLMELPLYRRPKFRVVLRNSLKRTKAYVVKTGPIILVLSLLIWAMSNFPKYQLEDPQQRLEQSYAAQIGQYIEPVFKPLGVDWRVGVGLISAFAAREVFVSTMAVLFHVTDGDEDSIRAGLIEKMREAKDGDGNPIFTFASVVGLLIFFMLALQCVSTSAAAKQETGSSQFVIVQLFTMNLLAYVFAALAHGFLN